MVDHILSRIKPVHLVLEGSISRIPSKQHILNFLSAVVIRINMTPVTEPVVVTTEETIVAFQVIAESHLAVHIHKPSLMLFHHCFSCREYDVGLVIDLAKQYFGLSNVNYSVLERTIAS